MKIAIQEMEEVYLAQSVDNFFLDIRHSFIPESSDFLVKI